MESLWGALGRPSLAAPLPMARTTSWRAARSSVRTALLLAGCPRCPWTPSGLWALMHHGRPAAGRTWGDVCEAATVADVVARLSQNSVDVMITSWNTRWLRDHASDAGRAERALIERWLLEGRIVMIQETHWDTTAAELWRATCAAGQVYYSNAVDGDEGSASSAGVATIVPRGWDVAGPPVVHIAGHCFDVLVRPPGGAETVRYRNAYGHPDRRAELLRRMATIPPAAEPLIMATD